MKLYTFPASPNCVKVAAVARHLGIDLEEQVVDLTKGESRKPEFLALNPAGRVPTLQDGDFILWESQAIMQYLADKHGPSDLWPQNLQARADVNRWMCWNTAHFGPAVGILLWEQIVKGLLSMGGPDAAQVERGLDLFRQHAAVLDGQLGGRAFVTGGQPTLADFALASMLIYAEPIGLPMAEFPNMQAWMGRMMGLESFRKSLPQMAASV